jgi:hypothetical protein
MSDRLSNTPGFIKVSYIKPVWVFEPVLARVVDSLASDDDVVHPELEGSCTNG